MLHRPAGTGGQPAVARPESLPGRRGAPRRPRASDAQALTLQVALVVTALCAATVVFTARGTGWTWGDPSSELLWYATGLADPQTAAQLLGNLALLAPTATCAVLLWPRLVTDRLLVRYGLAAGTGIETAQWLLPLGRVVSPVDAALNATGFVLAGRAVSALARRRPARAQQLAPAAQG